MIRTNLKLGIALTTLVFILSGLAGCKEAHISTGYINVSLSEPDVCHLGVNFTNDEVYAYRADHFFFVPSIQAGGFADGRELGFNLFALTTAGLTTGNYQINSGGGLPGTAYLFYYPDRNSSDVQYISMDGPSELLVTNLILKDNGNGLQEVEEIEFEFMGGTLFINDYENGDTICITGLTFGFFR